MKIFKNKVGRPSNEIKMLKRTFYISLVAIIASAVAIILSCAANIKYFASKSKGALFSDYTIKTSSNDSKKTNDDSWTNLWLYNEEGEYKIHFEVTNRKYGEGIYYRYFAYDADTGRLDYNSKKNGSLDSDICNTKIEKGDSKSKTIDKSIVLNSKNKKIKAVLKLYNNINDCKADDKGTGKAIGSKEMLNKLEYSNNNSSSTYGSNTNIVVSFFKWLFSFLKSIFGIGEDPGHGSHKETTLTPPVKTSLKMTSTSGIKHDIAVDCNTKVYAPFSGTATYKTKHKNGKIAGYGNVIEITSSDGVYEVKLAHLNSFVDYKVEYGYDQTGKSCADGSCSTRIYGEKSVKQGDYIGKTGSSGNSTGCHLHIELKKNGKRVDPSTYFGY